MCSSDLRSNEPVRLAATNAAVSDVGALGALARDLKVPSDYMGVGDGLQQFEQDVAQCLGSQRARFFVSG